MRFEREVGRRYVEHLREVMKNPFDLERTMKTEEQVTLEALQQFVAEHSDKDKIEVAAEVLRKHVAGENGEAMRIAICLVGAEMAAQ